MWYNIPVDSDNITMAVITGSSIKDIVLGHCFRFLTSGRLFCPLFHLQTNRLVFRFRNTLCSEQERWIRASKQYEHAYIIYTVILILREPLVPTKSPGNLMISVVLRTPERTFRHDRAINYIWCTDFCTG